jgi:hypothetical protein
MGHVVLEDINLNVWKMSLLLDISDESYNYNLLSWKLDESGESTNFLSKNVILNWGAFKLEGSTYGGSIQKAVVDGDYIYVVGTTTRAVRKYDLATLSLVASSPSQGGTVYDLVVTEDYVYAGGDEGKLYMYDKDTLSIVATSNNEESPGQIRSMCFSSYRGNVLSPTIITGSSEGRISFYQANSTYFVDPNTYIPWFDMSYTYQTSAITTIKSKDQLIFISSGDQIVKLTPSLSGEFDFSFVLYGGTIYSFDIDNNNIYVGGSTINAIKKYSIEDLLQVGESASYGGVINNILVSDGYVYAGGQTTQTVKIYGSELLSNVGESASYGGTIRTIQKSGPYIFVGGITTVKIRKYLDAHIIQHIREEI